MISYFITLLKTVIKAKGQLVSFRLCQFCVEAIFHVIRYEGGDVEGSWPLDLRGQIEGNEEVPDVLSVKLALAVPDVGDKGFKAFSFQNACI